MTIFEIEEKYDVGKIKVNGLYFWPFLRIYIGYILTTKIDGQVQVKKENIFNLIKSLFYGFFNLFKKTDYIFMSSSDQKKLIQNKYVDRMDFFINYLKTKNYLVLEIPNPTHFEIKQLTSKQISSKIWLNLIEKLFSYFISIKIENEELILKILEENNISFNYTNLAKKMMSQYKISSLFFKWKKPKILFLTTSYINLIRVKAAKQFGIKVVEFQHGIINKTHDAYTIGKQIDTEYYPDFLLTFGEKEKDVFNKNNFFIDKKNVLTLGSFYIDFLQNNKLDINDKFIKIRKKHKTIVSFSCQDPFDQYSIPFIIEAAILDKEIGFILMPRKENKAFFSSFEIPDNIYFISELNTYEKIILSDIHSTLFSTTAIEALSLGKPNILVNIQNLAKFHFKNILESNEFTFIVETPLELIKKIKSLPKFDENKIINSNRSNIAPNFKLNIKDIIDYIEK